MQNKMVSKRISSLPSRYEPLVSAFGDKAQTTFESNDNDVVAIKRLIIRMESSNQGKIMFIAAPSGTGKSTFIHSLSVFLSDKISGVIRLPEAKDLPVSNIPNFVSGLPVLDKITVVNFDVRETPSFDEDEYKNFLTQLNGILRSRADILILWPVADASFAQRLIELLETIGGRSPFGKHSVYDLIGLNKEQYESVLYKILQIANWKLEDAAVSASEISDMISDSSTFGGFLDELQELISERFDISEMGIDFPTLLIAISSSDNAIRELCRGLRRADSYYLESSRLLMYTTRSNVAEWWIARSSNMQSALPYVIALFNAQLVSLSASAVVHSVLNFGEEELIDQINGVTKNIGNAKRVIKSSELYKYASGEAIDNREYGKVAKAETIKSYNAIQSYSKTHHKGINRSLVDMMGSAGAKLNAVSYETSIITGLQSDVICKMNDESKLTALEFHHKSEKESTPNKVAIYILEKLKEYAINFGLAER